MPRLIVTSLGLAAGACGTDIVTSPPEDESATGGQTGHDDRPGQCHRFLEEDACCRYWFCFWMRPLDSTDYSCVGDGEDFCHPEDPDCPSGLTCRRVDTSSDTCRETYSSTEYGICLEPASP